MSMLSVRGITKSFGGVAANVDISFDVAEGELLGVIGPNGAGKTTLFHQISGFLKPDAGKVIFDGKDITGRRPDQVCDAGIGRTFQVVRMFSDMTVLDNVMIGAFNHTRSARKADRTARAIIERVGLTDRTTALAKELTLAGRKRVELARALATGAKLLLLDEVMAGLTPTEAEEAVALVRDLRQDLTIIMIEHVMEIVMPLSDRVLVLVQGEKLLEETPEVASTHPDVIAAYLGESFAGDK